VDTLFFNPLRSIALFPIFPDPVYFNEPALTARHVVFWSMRTAFDYRSLPVLDSAFSPDATIIALVHGSCVTLWDVESNQVLKTLDAGAGINLCRLAFKGAEGRFLVSTGQDRGVIVWDLLSCEGEYYVRPKYASC
jgi:WD40 repeat protein